MTTNAEVQRIIIGLDDLSTPSRTLRSSWICAGTASLALHLCVAAFAGTYLAADVNDGDLGANVIEVALDMEAPKLPNDDLPAGPDTEASKASPEVAEQKAEVKETDLPKAIEDETSDLASVLTPNDQEESKDEGATVRTQASQAQSESEATSRKALDDRAIESQNIKAPNIGIGKDQQKITANWGRKISAYLELHKRFPPGKIKAAKVGVNFVLNRQGKVVSADVEKSSGDTAYDAAAILMIQRSDPVPPAPADLAGAEFAFSLDVNFDASDRRSGS